MRSPHAISFPCSAKRRSEDVVQQPRAHAGHAERCRRRARRINNARCGSGWGFAGALILERAEGGGDLLVELL
eukprot:5489222-Prymnesium_polylepis.1